MEEKLQQLVAEAAGVDAMRVLLTRPEPKFGDYACNIALQLAKERGKNPRELADEIVATLGEDDAIDEATVAGPGFINIRLSNTALVAALDRVPVRHYDGQKVLIEYSDPNPLKPLHAGHLYTTLVGDSISRLLEVAGANVVRLNYGGDVGLHVGKSLWAIARELGGEYPEKLNAITEVGRPAWLGARYVEGNNAYEDDEAARAEIVATNKRVYELHKTNDHKSPFAQIYWTVRQWSYDYFATLYAQLDVKPFDRYIPESEVTQLGIDTVKEQTGPVYEESDGAIIFDGEKHGLHTRVFINSEGLPTYEAKEIGLSLTKWNDYKFDHSIIITASEQDQYMQVVLRSIEQFKPELAKHTQHITHGVVKLAGGVKMSSRKGNIVSALDIIDAAHQAGQESGRDVSEATTLASIKYAFAKNRIGGDIAYDPKESIALEGNSGPYLQYAHARARSILEKSGVQSPATPSDLADGERTLVLKLTQYQEVVERATKELLPHHICTYLYELAQTFNNFYEYNRVIGDERETTRVWLVAQYANVLKNGLELLGITAPNSM